MTPQGLHQTNTIVSNDNLEGRAQAAGLLGLFRRYPVISAVVLVAADIAIAVIVGLVAAAIAPPIPRLPDFIALCAIALAAVALVSFLGWWRLVGLNRPSQWRDLKLLALPALLVFLPLLGGFKVIDTGTVIFLLVGYLLTGFFEEMFFRGVIMRVLRPKGVWVAVLLSSLLFGLAHSTNLFLRFSGQPVIVGLQIIGVFTFGIGYAALRLRTNTIWPLIILHAATDMFLAVGLLPTLLIAPIQDTILLVYGLFLIWSMQRIVSKTGVSASEAQENALESQGTPDMLSQGQEARR